MFEEIETGLGWGQAAPAGWRRLVESPLLVVVGGMGAGKSTTMQALNQVGLQFHLLPNRRALTERLIVAPQQRQQGLPVQSLGRAGRLPYIRAYQQRFPAGMAHAVAQLWLAPDYGFSAEPAGARPLVFDGLRGEQEVRYALAELPQARFLCLSCPHRVRLERVLERHDPYDHFGAESATIELAPDTFAGLGLNEIQQQAANQLFSAADQQRLLALVASGQVRSAELRQKLDLFLEESSLYDIPAAIAYLAEHAPGRTQVIQTDMNLPAVVADQVLAWFAQPHL